MNVIKPNLSRPMLMGGWLTDAGRYLAEAGRSAAGIWNQVNAPTVVTTEEPDRTPLYLGLAGIGLIGAVLIMKPKRR